MTIVSNGNTLSTGIVCCCCGHTATAPVDELSETKQVSNIAVAASRNRYPGVCLACREISCGSRNRTAGAKSYLRRRHCEDGRSVIRERPENQKIILVGRLSAVTRDKTWKCRGPEPTLDLPTACQSCFRMIEAHGCEYVRHSCQP